MHDFRKCVVNIPPANRHHSLGTYVKTAYMTPIDFISKMFIFLVCRQLLGINTKHRRRPTLARELVVPKYHKKKASNRNEIKFIDDVSKRNKNEIDLIKRRRKKAAKSWVCLFTQNENEMI